MKLSFTRPSKSKQKPPENSSAESTTQNRELITEFDPSKTPISHPKQILIPPIQNQWRPHKRMKNLHLPPLHSDNTREFDLAPSDISAADQDGISYGLTLRKLDGGAVADADAVTKSDWSAMELNKFKTDVERAPDEPTLEEYDEVAVEDFAKALMAGYGWREGQGIGRNAKDDVKIVEYKRHTAKEGLGFMADPPPAPEKEVGRKKAEILGKDVRVVSGEVMGLKGRVLEVLEGGIVVLKVSKSEEEVKVRVDEVAVVGSVEEERCLRKLKDLRIRQSSGKEDSRRGERKRVDSDSSRKRSKDGDVRVERVEREERRASRVPWLASHIRVRVISKELKGGRYYLKKGEVVDVIRPGVCDISMDDGGQIVQAVDQDMLETALPRRGGMVLVLLGKHKGAYGSLVQKDTDRETGVVQDAQSKELINVGLEQVAEFVGDPSYLGY